MEKKEELIPIPMPAWVAVLLNEEDKKGEPLTESEVLKIRENATCIMMPVDVATAMAESRGYADIDPEYVWEQW